jgi:hypothetical protein
MRISVRSLAIAAAAGLAIIGCSADSSTSPALARGEGALLGTVGTIYSFTYNPASALSQRLGKHRIDFPARSVCDPARSTYGPTEWDAPCVALTTPITITAVVSKGPNGYPYLEFSPALRFVPTTDPSRYVGLYVWDPSASADPTTRLLFCTGLRCLDEARLDGSMTTVFDNPNQFIWRRIKHFSGYHVTARGDTTITEDTTGMGEQ